MISRREALTGMAASVALLAAPATAARELTPEELWAAVSANIASDLPQMTGIDLARGPDATVGWKAYINADGVFVVDPVSDSDLMRET